MRSKKPALHIEQRPVQQKPVIGTRAPWHAVVGFFGFAFAVIVISSALIGSVDAATYVGPSAVPPGGNVPTTIWNRGTSLAQQVNAAVDIDGNGGAFKGLAVGNAALAVALGQNLIYGNVDTASMGNLLLVQNESVDKFKVTASGDIVGTGVLFLGSAAYNVGAGTSQIQTNISAASAGNFLRFQNNSVNRLVIDSNGNVSVGGGTTASELRLLEPSAGGTNYTAFKAQLQAANVTYALPMADGTSGQVLTTNGAGTLSWSAVNACLSLRQYVGLAPAANGSRGGYASLNNSATGVCAGLYGATASVCTVEELMNSTKCGTALPGSGDAWVSGGPPGFTAPANDCDGWTNAGGSQLGRIWRFDANKGKGLLTTCNSSIAFACCR